MITDAGLGAGNYPTQPGEGLFNLALCVGIKTQKKQAGPKWDLGGALTAVGWVWQKELFESRAGASRGCTHCCPGLTMLWGPAEDGDMRAQSWRLGLCGMQGSDN